MYRYGPVSDTILYRTRVGGTFGVRRPVRAEREKQAVSSFLYLAGRRAFSMRKWVVLAWVAVLAVLGTLTLTAGGGLDNSVEIPGTESGDALERLAATFPQVSGASSQIVVVGPGGVAQGESALAITEATDALANMEYVDTVTPLVDEYAPAPISDDGTSALIMVQLKADQANVPDEVKDALHQVTSELNEALPEGSSAYLGGALFASEFPEISVTEALGVVVALIVLVFTLGTLIAAGLPLITALAGVGVSMSLLFIAARFAVINATTPLLAVMLGLAVGIDYSLFIVSRHRDQLKAGVPVPESVGRALGTAGSAVVFAGLTVMIALLGLAVAGIPFLTIMGAVGSAAVGIAVFAALTLLPAILGFAGTRILTKKERATLADTTPTLAADAVAPPAPNRFFRGWVTGATAKPAVTIVVVVAALGALSVPALGLRLALPDAGVLPEGNEARVNYEIVADKFGEGFNGPLVVTTSIVTSMDPLGLMADLQEEIEALPGVASVAMSTPNLTADTGIVQVIPEGGPVSEETGALVHDIRGMHDYLEDEYGVDIAVTGYTAVGIDVSGKLSEALLPFAIVVVGLSLVLLAIVFRSIAVPVTAALGYLLTVGSTFGITVLVFEHGFLADFIGVTRLGPIINFMPIITMGILFGLSMDYEVFLVARMREDYVHTGRARKSVITGFLGSAKVVTAAAIIMVSVFAAFVPEGDMSLKPIAFGLAIGVAIDAFIVRMTLIPAVMMWLGDRAWWLPKWLDKALPVFDIEGESVIRQRSLKDWPEIPNTAAAADLVVEEGTPPLSVLVPPSTSVLVTGDTQTVRPLLRAVSGREAPSSGTLKVLDFLLPERAGAVRRRVAYVNAGPPTTGGAARVREQVGRAIREGAAVVAVDLGENIMAAAGLDATPTLKQGGPVLIVGANSRPPIPEFLEADQWEYLTLDRHARQEVK